ncbi:MAG: nuclear transport factor 2 family protein [Proteobacteria bacterium]|nr:nuclear transport factor 2 family protein [Pseudomonadota bacterium]
MSNYQDSKALVLNFYEELEATSADHAGKVLSRYTSSDYRFRGVHPFNELDGADAVAEAVWKPLLTAFTPMQRRQDIFMAGTNNIDGTEWVTSMGKFMGLFDDDWLGIPATGKITFLPYVEFSRIDDGRICESAFFCDIISVMKQAGLTPLPIQTGAEIINPGPRTHDGLMFAVQDEAESRKTLDLVNRMCDDLVADGLESPSKSLARTWHEDMIWFGPSGIGATYTIDRYQAQHQGPFGAGLENIVFNGHVCNYAEGNYAGWFGWPNLTMTSSGGFMGLPASDRRIHMRVVDMYRRDGDKLAENWIFIDMLYWMMQQDVDVLERTRQIVRG